MNLVGIKGAVIDAVCIPVTISVRRIGADVIAIARGRCRTLISIPISIIALSIGSARHVADVFGQCLNSRTATTAILNKSIMSRLGLHHSVAKAGIITIQVVVTASTSCLTTNGRGIELVPTS